MKIVGAFLLAVSTSSVLAQSSITFIDPPAGQRDITPLALSPDGLTFVGDVYEPSQPVPFTGFRWSLPTNTVYLPTAFPNAFTEPHATSTNAAVIVGESSGQAVRWTLATGTVVIGPLRSSATDVSADGQTIVGTKVLDTLNTGFIKVGEAELVTLLPLPGMTDAFVNAVSANGLTTVGRSWKPGFGDGEQTEVYFRPVKWINGGAPQVIETPDAPWQNGEALDVSADGSIIVGTLTHATEGTQKAFVSTPNGVTLIPVPCDADCSATAVSADGRVIIGDSTCGPWIWDGVREVRFLNQAATMNGLNLQDVTLEFSRGVSADGTRILVAGNRGFNFDPMAVLLQMPVYPPQNCSSDFNGDWNFGTDADIEAFFACLAGNCCPTCGTSDFNNDGDYGTDQDIEAFFRVLSGGTC